MIEPLLIAKSGKFPRLGKHWTVSGQMQSPAGSHCHPISSIPAEIPLVSMRFCPDTAAFAAERNEVSRYPSL